MIDNRKLLLKPEILITLKRERRRRNSNGKSGIFDHGELDKSVAK